MLITPCLAVVTGLDIVVLHILSVGLMVRLINPSNLRNRSFKPLLKHAGLPDICFHDLRHTCATLLLS